LDGGGGQENRFFSLASHNISVSYIQVPETRARAGGDIGEKGTAGCSGTLNERGAAAVSRERHGREA
jgi:hypothetical protein